MLEQRYRNVTIMKRDDYSSQNIVAVPCEFNAQLLYTCITICLNWAAMSRKFVLHRQPLFITWQISQVAARKIDIITFLAYCILRLSQSYNTNAGISVI